MLLKEITPEKFLTNKGYKVKKVANCYLKQIKIGTRTYYYDENDCESTIELYSSIKTWGNYSYLIPGCYSTKDELVEHNGRYYEIVEN